jgi:hypothetical protein
MAFILILLPLVVIVALAEASSEALATWPHWPAF